MNKQFWYEYLLRGPSPGCQPSGFKEINHSHGRYGKVAYGEPLKPEQIENYDLLDLNKSELEKQYEELKYKLLVKGDLDQVNPENVALLLEYIEELKGS